MRIRLISVGSRVPEWVESGYQEYARRLPREMPLELVEIPLARRHKNYNAQQCINQEGDAILKVLTPRDLVVALEVKGKPWTTEKLSEHLASWRTQGMDVALLIGGPDGLSDTCRARALQQWSLSALTLPHPLVRVILAEQIYRAWSILQGHPYHRE
ncbi:MAG: 23S rRNA (pseudouridine(1915)-N(3))-methyltransferase RlmH [Hahellaceae bacterium]|jgi:23S rRNA (pseudouridine1915-N3)-methyltransferase|nr:23S rRNA (pseudouridine(1915)-N(3))-methyltransferase RlmH [Hahellaceae bacterium]